MHEELERASLGQAQLRVVLLQLARADHIAVVEHLQGSGCGSEKGANSKVT